MHAAGLGSAKDREGDRARHLQQSGVGHVEGHLVLLSGTAQQLLKCDIS